MLESPGLQPPDVTGFVLGSGVGLAGLGTPPISENEALSAAKRGIGQRIVLVNVYQPTKRRVAGFQHGDLPFTRLNFRSIGPKSGCPAW